jgi:hypothetical protein
MSSPFDYEILFELSNRSYADTSSWVLPNIFKESFPKEKEPEFVMDTVLNRPSFKLDGQFPQYK